MTIDKLATIPWLMSLMIWTEIEPLTVGHRQFIAGWWLSPTPIKNDGVKVSWDDYSFPFLNGKS
jgi:hypothetical protein